MIKCILLLLLLTYVHVVASSCNPDWTAPDGTTCQMYIDMELCDGNFGYGDGWYLSLGYFSDHMVNGQTAMVCPQCGCDESFSACTAVYTKLSWCGPNYNDMYCYDPLRPFCDVEIGWCQEHPVEEYNFVTKVYYEEYDYHSYWVNCLATYGQNDDCYGRCDYYTPTQSCQCNPDCSLYQDCCQNYDQACNVEIPGCTDLQANTFDPLATKDDGSCLYGILGCMDPLADNYQPQATTDDGSCEQACYYYEFQCGVYCTENNWLIRYSHNGEIVCDEVGGNRIGGCCLPEPHCGYTIEMTDTEDDGWNGGKLFINDQTYTLTGAESTLTLTYIEAVNCEEIKNEGCTDSTALNYHISNNWDDGTCEYGETCGACCHHDDCPSDTYCAMGQDEGGSYNGCYAIEQCGTGDQIEPCPTDDGTDTGGVCSDYTCCSHSECGPNEYCALGDYGGANSCYPESECGDWDDEIEPCPNTDTDTGTDNGGNSGVCTQEVCCSHAECDADEYCSTDDTCYPMFECGTYGDEIEPCSGDEEEETDNGDDDGDDDDDDDDTAPVVYCTECCSHDDCNSDQYCATEEYNGLPYTTCYALSECGEHGDEISLPCPTPELEVQIWAGDGCPGAQGAAAIGGGFKSKSSTAHVRCCDGGVCSTPFSCGTSSPKSYDDAAEKCQSEGKSLCSKEELESSTCCSMGGNCDDSLIWSSTEAITDCNGVVGGSAEYDACAVCEGNGSSCADCFGEPNGGAIVDDCGTCGGDGSECAPEVVCLDYLFTPDLYASEVSWELKSGSTVVCSGAGGAEVESECCVDANSAYTLEMEDSYGDGWDGGILTIGNKEYTLEDGYSGTLQVAPAVPDCFGVLGGSAVKDVCNVCDGNGQSCLDCNGVANGGATSDICGICGGDGSSCTAQCLDYTWTPGSYKSEVSWQLHTGGSTVCSGAGGVEAESDCCPLPTDTYTLSMQDSYGDGWNGGILKIGTEEYTLENGATGSVEIGASVADTGMTAEAWVDDGCPGSQGSDAIVGGFQSILSTLTGGVRCCGGGSSCSTPVACGSGTEWTYNDAAMKCQSEGKSLCTKEELNNSLCCSKGGACDDFAMWTSTGTDGESIGDCYGVIGGSAVEDKCGICGGDGSGCTAGCLDYNFVCGEWCGEISWQLQTGGLTVCSGSGGSHVESECCPEPVYTYTLSMQDSYGDGWNGGILTVGDEQYTIAEGASLSLQIAAIEEGPAANTAYTVSSVASLSIGDGDDPNDAAAVAAAAFGNTLGAAPGSTSFNILGRRSRRQLGQSLDVEITMTTDDADSAADAVAAASKPSFASSMASEMANVAAEMGVSVTVESLEASAPTEGTIATGCPALAKSECKDDTTCDYNKEDDTCTDKLLGCPGFTKKNSCRDADCSWNADSMCVEKLPGCAGYSKRSNCKDDDGCLWDKDSEVCLIKLTGCGANGSKAQCWKDSNLVCEWSFDSSKCVDGVCTGKEKSPCKKSPKCSWERKDGDTKICYDAEE